MPPQDVVYRRLGLRTQPFFPQFDAEGKAIRPAALRSALDPHIDPAVLKVYYDIYDWTDSAFIRDLSPTAALRKFPPVGSLSAKPLILVSGGQSSGRDSLVNLINHKIELVHGVEPFVMKSKLAINNKESVKILANNFKEDWPANVTPAPEQEATRTLFDTRYAANLNAEGSDEGGYFTSMFRAFYNIAHAAAPDKPIVFVIHGSENFDRWRCVYNSANELFDYLIVQTFDDAAAKACMKFMPNVPTVHINARKLQQESALNYARTRIGSQRLPHAGADDLLPLTIEAIAALYEFGDRAVERERPLEWPIGFLRKTLQTALDRHIERLVALVERNGETALIDDELRITKELIADVREELNLR